MKKDQVLLEVGNYQGVVRYYIYENLELTNAFLQDLIAESESSVEHEWERLTQHIVMYMYLIEERSSLLITKETMKDFIGFLNIHAGLKVVKTQY